MIEQKKPMGILPLLDEECKRPGGNVQKYQNNLNSGWSRNKNYRKYKGNSQFVLTHYAGDVIYDVNVVYPHTRFILGQIYPCFCRLG